VNRRAAVAFIFVTVVLDVLALGIIIPVLPRLVEGFLGGDTVSASYALGVFGTVWALMQFIWSPILGVVSDRFGRRRVILISNFGLGLDYILMAMSPSLAWLFAGRVISGITGASFTAASAYIADITPQEKRAGSYGIIGAAWGLGFVLGPAMGGLLGQANPRLPFWVAAGLTLLNALYGLFVLPESLPVERRRPIEWRRASPFGSLRLLRSHHELFGLATVSFLYYLAHQVLPSVYVLYVSYRYAWDERTTGLTLALFGVLNIVVQGVLVKRVVARLGERRALVIGLVMGAAGYAVYGFANESRTFLLGIPIGMFMGFVGPSVQGLMTRRVSATEQGQLQGINSSIMGLTGMIGPGVFTLVFARFIDQRGPWAGWHLPGAPFLLAALCVVSAAVLASRATMRVADAGAGVAGAR